MTRRGPSEPHLAAVDRALEADACAAGTSALPEALRGRILAAARPAGPAPRGRLIVDLLLRCAAVAAVLVAALAVLPQDVLATEPPSAAVLRLTEPFDAPFGTSIRERAAWEVPFEIPAPGEPALLGAVALALVAAGWVLARREDPR